MSGKTSYTLRIRMGHVIDYERVMFAYDTKKPGNTLNQFEAEIARIVAEETASVRAELERVRGERDDAIGQLLRWKSDGQPSGKPNGEPELRDPYAILEYIRELRAKGKS